MCERGRKGKKEEKERERKKLCGSRFKKETEVAESYRGVGIEDVRDLGSFLRGGQERSKVYRIPRGKEKKISPVPEEIARVSRLET